MESEFVLWSFLAVQLFEKEFSLNSSAAKEFERNERQNLMNVLSEQIELHYFEGFGAPSTWVSLCVLETIYSRVELESDPGFLLWTCDGPR